MAKRLFHNCSCDITVYDNFCSGKMSYLEEFLSSDRFNLVEGDVMNLPLLSNSMNGHDIVFHFAANPDIAKSLIETDLDLRLGIIATYNVVESMRTNGVGKIVYSSGSGVYGDVGEKPTPENFGPLLPSSMYGASKLGAEGVISAFCNMFDMKAWIYRFANVVGRHQTHGVGYDFIRKLFQNHDELLILGDGNQSKSYIHVDDVLDAILYVLSKTNDVVNVHNVATDDYITVNEIADIVAMEMAFKNVNKKYTGGQRGWKGDVPVVRFDLTKVKKLGWKVNYSSKQAIQKSIKELLTEV